MCRPCNACAHQCTAKQCTAHTSADSAAGSGCRAGAAPSTAQHLAVYRRTVTASQLRAPGAAGAGVRREGGRRRLRVAPLAVAIGVRHQRRKHQVVGLEPRPRVDAAVDVCGTHSAVDRKGVLYQQAPSLHEQCHRTNRRTFANPDEPEAKAELETIGGPPDLTLASNHAWVPSAQYSCGLLRRFGEARLFYLPQLTWNAGPIELTCHAERRAARQSPYCSAVRRRRVCAAVLDCA